MPELAVNLSGNGHLACQERAVYDLRSVVVLTTDCDVQCAPVNDQTTSSWLYHQLQLIENNNSMPQP